MSIAWLAVAKTPEKHMFFRGFWPSGRGGICLQVPSASASGLAGRPSPSKSPIAILIWLRSSHPPRNTSSCVALAPKLCFVGEGGLEPPLLAEHGSKPCAYTNSATRPPNFYIFWYKYAITLANFSDFNNLNPG